MNVPRVDPKNAAGLVDKAVGLGKEVLGTVIGQDNLTRAGQVQQEKGTERIKALQSQMQADAAQAKATSAKQSQKAAQATKEASN